MGRSVREPLSSLVPERERSQELIRPDERRRQFSGREAHQHLQRKETRWAPIAYGVFLLAIAGILFLAYSSYVFSKYRGEILPGVQVDGLKLGGLTEKQATNAILFQLASIQHVPVQLTYGRLSWKPKQAEIGLSYDLPGTAREAMQVGRQGAVVTQLVDRLPLHPSHSIPLLYRIDENRLRAYIKGIASDRNIYLPPQNANLHIGADTSYKVELQRSQEGTHLDVTAASASVHAALGSLSVHIEPLSVIRTQPAITNVDAGKIRDTVERFLSHTPVIALGKRVLVTNRQSFGPMFSFSEPPGKRPTIQLSVDPNKVSAYIASLAAQIDRPAIDAKLNFQAGQIQVITPQQTGRTLDQQAAFQALLPIVKGLQPNARLHFALSITQPPIDQSNPASLGIRQLLGMGSTSFDGAGLTRLTDITNIAKSLNQDLLSPTGDISFNTLVGSGWSDRTYADRERAVNGRLVPAGGGAMDQVATTFLRAMYGAGLKLEERHSHVYRLPWYEPPIGLDAVVAPGRNWDLRFANTTGKYLLIETVVQPIRHELYIYVYGPKLGWHVSVDQQGQVTKVYPHGGQIRRTDPSLAPGQVQQISWAADGADTVVQRTITFPNGNVQTDEVRTHYQASSSIVTIGNVPKATATPTKSSRVPPPPTGLPSPTVSPAPTPTFSH